MTKLRTRFVIGVGEQVSELFSVRERPYGDLVVIFNNSYQHGDAVANTYTDTLEHRVSVHVSPNSAGNTVVQHLRLADGSYRKVYAFILPRNGRLLWPLLMASCQNLAPEHYKSEPREGDIKISMGAYDPRYNVLIYFILVTAPPEFSIRAPFGMNYVKATFSNFSVMAYWAFMASPSTHQGDVLVPSTAWSLEEGVNKSEYKLASPAIAKTRGEIEHLTRRVIDQYVENQYVRLKHIFASKGDVFPEHHLDMMRMILRDPREGSA
jgi:hypothetical protein